jgi:hypothetical protein
MIGQEFTCAHINFIAQSECTCLLLSLRRTLSAKNCRVITMLDEEMTKKLSAVLKKPVLHFPDITDEAPPILNHPILEKIKEKAKR